MARLKIRRHEQEYSDLVLTPGQSYSLGRKEDCDVVLQPDPGISRNHIKIEFANNFWTVQVLSPHIPITFEGKNLPILVCKENKTNFYVSPYHFELIADTEVVQESEVKSNDSYLENNDFSGLPETPADENISAQFNAFNSEAAPPVPDAAAAEPAVDPEVSFHGNEEATRDVFQGDEPYLKFMYPTHSESIRLKGNKWVAGRDSIAQIHLDDKKASRQHFCIEKVGVEYFVKDLGSANGTLLNGQELGPEPRDIKSGDIITVNQLTIIFELRDLSFSEKLKDLPLQVYSGPMILTSQEWDIASPSAPQLPVDKLAQLPGTVEKMEAPKNRLRQALMAGVAVIILAAGILFNGESRTPASNDESMKSFESLSIEDKKTVVDAYNAAQNFYKEAHFQNALNRLSAIHKILPFYKDSLDLQTRLIEAQETLRQQEFIAQQRREAEKVKLKVGAIVADCRDRYQDSVDVTATKNCLNEALSLDPENSDAQSILAEVEMRLAQAEEATRRQKEYDENVDKGRELFYKAKNHYQNQEFHDAISAFSAHVNANLPDPDGLKEKSQRNISSIEKMIDSQKGKFMKMANQQLSQSKHKEAISYAQQARKIDPFDYNILNFIEETNRDLESQMRNLYMDAGLEEKFGNTELSKAKWKEIIKRDTPTGTYYIKAKRKLQQYGF